MIVPRTLAHIQHKWMMKGQENGKQAKKVGKIEKLVKRSTKCDFVIKKLSYYIKKVNKIFWFSEDIGASAWEGIQHSGWNFLY